MDMYILLMRKTRGETISNLCSGARVLLMLNLLSRVGCCLAQVLWATFIDTTFVAHHALSLLHGLLDDEGQNLRERLLLAIR